MDCSSVSCFKIKDKKTLIFRKESDEFITFDPIDLEYSKLNATGSQIMYLISKQYKREDIIEFFINKYNLEKNFASKVIDNFINNFSSKLCISELLKTLNFDLK